MHRIDSANAVNQRFVAGIPGVQDPTHYTAAWSNALQEEIVHVIEEAGLELDKADNTQLLQAILQVIAANAGGDGFTHPTTHPWSILTGIPAFASRWPSWDEVTDKPETSSFQPQFIESKPVDGLNTVSFSVVEGRNCFYFSQIRPDGVASSFYMEFKYQGVTVGGSWKRANPSVYENNPLRLTEFQANSSGTPLEGTIIDGSRNDLYYPLGMNGFYCFDYIKNSSLTAVKSSQASIPNASFQCDYWGDDRFFGLNGFESPVGTNVDEVVFHWNNTAINFESGGVIERFSVGQEG